MSNLTIDQFVTIDERRARIMALDLECVVFKLTEPDHGKPPEMSLAQADTTVVLYRWFLTLALLYPNKSIVPTIEIDAVWHRHIQDTRKYRQDCDWIFGYPFDHFPYLGLRGDADVVVWNEEFFETCRLFQEHFGVDLLQHSAAKCGDFCRGHCGDPPSCDGRTKEEIRPRPNREFSLVG